MSLQDLIPVVNKLHDIATATNVADLDLPILAVVGSQSCGKSSVLENIVGRDFLPRGTGIVTRRPLILQLIHTSDGPEVAEFLHLPGKQFTLFSEVRDEIAAETDRIAGANKGISRIPINLKIHSPNVLDLTLVDLPGLTKIPIGDQPKDIERQTHALITEFVSRPNCIILAVSPANVDIVNSESLKLARHVDPAGKRTVGILTKLDLMDHGTNALDILSGSVYPLKLGFVGIVNRLQYDITSEKSLPDSLEAERQFFALHPAYRTIASRCGTSHLAYTLSRILMTHIRDRLPDIKARLTALISQQEKELAQYGELTATGTLDKAALILSIMTRFAAAFVSSIDGTASADWPSRDLCAGARIYHLFNDVLRSKLLNINPTHNLLVRDIRTAIRNSTGPRPSLFVPELAFDLLVKPQIKMLMRPSQKCVELVHQELVRIVHSVCTSPSPLAPEMRRYPRLQAQIVEVCTHLLRERLDPTVAYVNLLIDINTAYINTNHPNFVGAAKAMSDVVHERNRLRDAEQQRHQRLASEKLRAVVEADVEEEANDEVNGHGIVIGDNDSDAVGSDTTELVVPARANGYIEAEPPAVPPQPHLRRALLTLWRSDLLLQYPYHNPDLYLNYFFGKDPLAHQQHMQTQAQLHPTPFKFPVHPQDAHLQFTHSKKENGLSLGPGAEDESFSESDEAFNDLSEREQMECELIRRLIVSYFGIVRETIMDQVPKSIMCLLVNHIKTQIQNRLVMKLYHSDQFTDLLLEEPEIVAERAKCEELLRVYQEAADVIADVI